MTDDLETVREALQGVFVTSSDEDEAFDQANAALDRIDSRLRAAETRQSNLPSKKWLDAFDEQRRLAHDLEHERDRLRASAEAFQNEARILRQHLTERDAECDRLRTELGRVIASKNLVQVTPQCTHRDEVDRLQKEKAAELHGRREAEAECDRLRKALEGYGCHDPGCAFLAMKNPHCDCGFTAALEGTSDE